MILLHILKKNFSLIGKGFYFKVVKCMLDIPSPITTSSLCPLILLQFWRIDGAYHIKDVSFCSLYQTKGFFNE
jgi:hypothetical protein